jgi:hypothetical protein
MQIVRAGLFILAGVGLLSAQQYGSIGGFGSILFPGTGHAPASRTPFGNILFPGNGGPPGYNAFSSVTNPSFAGRLGATVGGFGAYRGGGRHRGGGGGYAPYAYPVYVGGSGYGYGYGSGYGYGYDPSAQQQQQGNVMVIYPPPTPPVVINQNFTAPPASSGEQPQDNGSDTNMHLYQAPSNNPEPAASSNETPYYLIAFKDHSIYTAVAYYIEGDTLHYFTSGNVHNQVSLSLVDQPLTQRLNSERGVDVKMTR